MTPEMKQWRMESGRPWRQLTAVQQTAVTQELARLLCQYVQSHRDPKEAQQKEEVARDEPASQDK